MAVCTEKQEDFVSPEKLYVRKGAEKLLVSLMIVITLAVKLKKKKKNQN